MKTEQILICFLLIHSVLGVKSSDYCSLVKDRCYSIKNKTSIECTKSACNTREYNYKCGVDFCSRDVNSCKELHAMVKELKSLRMLKLKITIDKLFTKLAQKYDIVIRGIKDCHVTKYEWKPNEICLRGVKCRQLEKLSLRYGGINLMTPIECPCTVGTAYSCEKTHCARDFAACQGFLAMKSLSDQFNITKSCGNSFSVIRKKISK